jgi:hypothetical protein
MVFETIAFADFANPAERAKRYRMTLRTGCLPKHSK